MPDCDYCTRHRDGVCAYHRLEVVSDKLKADQRIAILQEQVGRCSDQLAAERIDFGGAMMWLFSTGVALALLWFVVFPLAAGR